MFKFERNSIRVKLFFSISGVITLSLLLIYSLGFFNTKNEIQEILDANMAKSAKLVLALIYHEIEEEEKEGFLEDFEEQINQRVLHKYESQIYIQVWHKGNLVYNSNRENHSRKPKKEGFADLLIDGRNWRQFTLFDQKKNIEIVMLEAYEIRNELMWRILASPFIPLGISTLMILLIWFFIDKKIGVLNILSNKIVQTSPNKLEVFDLNPPLEIKPLVDSLNHLILRLADSIQSERRFTDYAAHELRTPLAVIKTHVQLLIKDKKKAQDEEYLRDLEKAVERMIHLINQILILSRLEPESLDVKREDLLLNEIIIAEINNLEKDAHDKEITFNFMATNKKVYFGNKTYVEIMIRNLLDNAVKYAEFGSEIRIDLEFNNSGIAIKISNFGEFVDELQREKIFDVFYRIKSSDVLGCGLGLAIAKKIVRLHKGKITFDSQRIDKNKALNEVKLILRN
jgi:two-component system sensor histidine kinase QseC